MSTRTILEIKSLFETGDKPVAQDFVDLIDTLHDTATSILPPVANNDGKVLCTDGTGFYWAEISLLNFRNSWNAAQQYITNEIVTFNGSSWIAAQNSLGMIPGVVYHNAQGQVVSYWYLLCAKGETGVQGAQGPQGVRGNSGINLVPKGAWVNSTTYYVNDCVTQGGSAYRCIQSNIGNVPTPGEYWEIFVSIGEQGPQGVQGSIGTQGPQGSTGIGNLIYAGNYNASTNYELNDLVSYEEKLWRCLTSTVGITPVEGSNWSIVLSGGLQGETGAQGPQGDKGEIGTNAIIRGAWVGSTAYSVNDGVSYGGSLWLCIQSCTGVTPVEGMYWTQMLSKGDTGPQGPQGVQGSIGLQGSPGINGTNLVSRGSWNISTVYSVNDLVISDNKLWACLSGNIGQNPQEGSYWTLYLTGVQGPQGTQGAIGSTGVQGAASTIPGPQGLTGPQGPQGSQGSVGAASTVQGPQGVTGSQGPQGLMGMPGTNGIIRGAWSSATTYDATDIVTYLGSTWYALQGNLNQIPQAGIYWGKLLDSGSQGTQGPQGLTGPQGSQGAQGPQGFQGIPGVDGFNFTGDWSSVTVYSERDGVLYNGNNWYCKQANTNQAPQEGIYWMLFTPKGDRGADGVNLVSKGAYDSAVTYAPNDLVTYQGSAYKCLQTCLAVTPSVGDYWDIFVAQGATGPQGAQGPQGSVGETGPQGSQGATGIQGAPSALIYLTFLDKGVVNSGNVNFNLSDALHQKATIGAITTISLDGWVASGYTGELLIELVNAGAYALTWPTNINWIKADGSFTTTFSANGVTLQTAGTDFCVIWSHDGGTTYYGKFLRG